MKEDRDGEDYEFPHYCVRRASGLGRQRACGELAPSRSVNSRAANSEVANAADLSGSSPEWLDTREFLGVYVSSF